VIRARIVAGLTAAVLLLSGAAAAGARAEDVFAVRAIGDSVPAGFGLGGESLLDLLRCARRMPTSACDHPLGEAYPAIFARGLNAEDTGGLPVSFDNHAVSGAVPGQFLPGGRFNGRTKLVLVSDPDAIVVTVGADDLLADKLCALRGRRCARRLLQRANTTENVAALLRIFARGTGAEVYLVLYHRTDSDVQGAVLEVNRAVRAAAARFPGDVVVVEPPSFAGHSCSAPRARRWMLGWRDLCLHPNERGSAQIAAALLRAFR
jgi:lysophospholipase L1-like esterase